MTSHEIFALGVIIGVAVGFLAGAVAIVYLTHDNRKGFK